MEDEEVRYILVAKRIIFLLLILFAINCSNKSSYKLYL